MERVQAEISLGVHFCCQAMGDFEQLSPALRTTLERHFLACLIGGEEQHQRFLELQRGALWNPWLPLAARASEPAPVELARAVWLALEAYNRGGFGLVFAEPSVRRLRRTCVQWIWRRGEFVPLYNYELEPRPSRSSAASACRLPWDGGARTELGIGELRSLQARYELELSYRPAR